MLIKNLKPKFPKIKYVSIGSGEEENNLLKLSKELRLEKEATFLKNIDEQIALIIGVVFLIGRLLWIFLWESYDRFF